MNVFLVSEDESLARSIRQIMMRERVYCPLSAVVSFDQAERHLAGMLPDLIVAVLPEDPIRCVEALEILAHLPRSDRSLVIAIGPAADAKLVIRALRGVVDDYLDVADLENELVMVLGCWTQRWAIDRPEGMLVAVLSPSGGSGSSTVAANLAIQASRSLESVGLIDLKRETGDLATLLDLKPTHSLADLCKNIDRLDQHFFQQSLGQHPSGVHLLSAPKHLADLDLVTPEGIRQVMGLARASFPLVVADVEHRFGTEEVLVLRQADVILVVMRLDFTSLKNATRFLDHLDGLGIAAAKIKLVINRLGQPREVPIAKVEEALHAKVFHCLPDDPSAVNRANNHGVPVLLDAPNSKIARSLAKLTQMIQPAPAPAREAPANAGKVIVQPGATSVTHPGSSREPGGHAADYRPNLTSRVNASELANGTRT